MKSLQKLILLDSLTRHESNVRNLDDDPAIVELTSSIQAIGLINPLTVTENANEKYGVIAGGRRLAALKLLAADGKLPPSLLQGIPCQILEDVTSLTEISLSENVQRDRMSTADQIVAWGKLVNEGLTAGQIATRFGVDEKLVHIHIALANVIPEVLDLLRNEEITFETVKAFTLTDDPEKQREALKIHEDHLHEWTIRRHFSADTISATNKRVRFVGLQSYLDAGGTVTRDLFNEDETLLHDEDILNDLCTKKLEEVRDEWRAKGWANVLIETDDELNNLYMTYRRASAIEAEPTEVEAARMKEITAIFDVDEDEDIPNADELEDELNAIETAIEDRGTWPEDIMQKGTVAIRLSYNGTLDISPGWIKRDDVKKLKKSKATDGDDNQRIYSENHWTELASIRTEIVHVALLDNTTLLNDLTTFQLAVEAQNQYDYMGYERYGSITLGHSWLDPDDEDKPFHKAIAKQYKALKRTWIKPDDINERFQIFRKLTDDQKMAWARWAMAASISVRLDRSVREAAPMAFDHIIPELGIDWAKVWRPGEDYFGRLSKNSIFKMMRPVLGDEWIEEHTALKKATLVQKVADIVTGKAKSLTAEQQASVDAWIPPGFEPQSMPNLENRPDGDRDGDLDGDPGDDHKDDPDGSSDDDSDNHNDSDENDDRESIDMAEALKNELAERHTELEAESSDDEADDDEAPSLNAQDSDNADQTQVSADVANTEVNAPLKNAIRGNVYADIPESQTAEVMTHIDDKISIVNIGSKEDLGLTGEKADANADAGADAEGGDEADGKADGAGEEMPAFLKGDAYATG